MRLSSSLVSRWFSRARFKFCARASLANGNMGGNLVPRAFGGVGATPPL
jgi:hypothetical protein